MDVLGNRLLHGEEVDVFGDALYQGTDKRTDAKQEVTRHVAMRPGKRKELDKDNKPMDVLIDLLEKIKAGIRAKVKHPLRIVKCQFAYNKVRYRGLKKKCAVAQDAVCATEPADGQAQVDGSAGVSAPENRREAVKAAQTAQTAQKGEKKCADQAKQQSIAPSEKSAL